VKSPEESRSLCSTNQQWKVRLLPPQLDGTKFIHQGVAEMKLYLRCIHKTSDLNIHLCTKDQVITSLLYVQERCRKVKECANSVDESCQLCRATALTGKA